MTPLVYLMQIHIYKILKLKCDETTCKVSYVGWKQIYPPWERQINTRLVVVY